MFYVLIFFNKINIAGIYNKAVIVAPKTPILIAHASGLKKILANISGKNPPKVVSEVVIICLVDLITTSIKSDFVIETWLAFSFICDKTIIESLIERPIKPRAPTVPINP